MGKRKKRTSETPPEYELRRQEVKNKCSQCDGTGRVISSNSRGDEYMMRCPCTPPEFRDVTQERALNWGKK